MAPVTMASIQTKTRLKRKRVSKKNKKSWRKHSNIKDIEDFLEDQRLQERTGGIIAEKEDSSLFFVDSAIPTAKKAVTKNDKYFFRNKPLKSHGFLLPDPSILPARKTKPQRTKQTAHANLPRVKRIAEDRKHGILPAKEAEKLAVATTQRRAKKRAMDIHDKTKDELPSVYNIWETGVQEDVPKKLEGADQFFLLSTKRTRRKSTKMIQPTKVPSVEVVDPGASYNPSFEDHQKLLQKMYDAELIHLNKAEILSNWHKGVPKVPAHKYHEIYLQEMSAGLFETETESKQGEESDRTTKETNKSAKEPKKEAEERIEMRKGDKNEKKQVKSVVEEDDIPLLLSRTTSTARKTRQQKRKQKLQKSAETVRFHAKAERVRLNDVYRLRTLRRQIALDEKLQARKLKRLAAKREEFSGQTKKLGRHSFEAAPVLFKLSSQLTGSLRELKPEGCLITDRYKSMQKRNLIESRIWKRGVRPHLKDYVKKSHKEIMT